MQKEKRGKRNKSPREKETKNTKGFKIVQKRSQEARQEKIKTQYRQEIEEK